MLDAALALLESEGPEGVTHLRVAERAGVSRATVYRHWPDRIDLIADLVSTGTAVPAIGVPAEGSARERLVAAIERAATMLDADGTASFLLLLSRSQWDDRIADVRRNLVSVSLGALISLIEEGVASGEFTLRTSPDLAVDQLFGPILVRRLLRDESVDGATIAEIVDSVLG